MSQRTTGYILVAIQITEPDADLGPG